MSEQDPESQTTDRPASSDAPAVRGVEYLATCAQCGFTVRGTWEDLQIGGWLCVPRGEQGLPSQWFDPPCVHGLTRA